MTRRHMLILTNLCFVILTLLLVLLSCVPEKLPSIYSINENPNNQDIQKTIKTPTQIDAPNVEVYSKLCNEYRQLHGLKPLYFAKDLNLSALRRVAEIRTDFSHISKNGYNKNLGENIIMGVHTNKEILDSWISDIGYNGNLLAEIYVFTGFAASYGCAVQLFSKYATENSTPHIPNYPKP